MRARELMKEAPVTVSPDESLTAALQTMRWNAIRHLPVMRERHLVGVLSDRDLLRHLGLKGSLEGRVGDAMTVPPRSVRLEDSAEDIVRVLAEHDIGCAPVVAEDGTLAGIVGRSDVLASVAERATEPRPSREPATQRFADRAAAGRRLAEQLQVFRSDDLVVIGLAPGGVPIAYEAAVSLEAPLEVWSGRPFRLSLRNRTILVADDGLSGAAALRAAIRAIGQEKPRRVIAAWPVATRAMLEEIESIADHVVCPCPCEELEVEAHYGDVTVPSEEEVAELVSRRHVEVATRSSSAPPSR